MSKRKTIFLIIVLIVSISLNILLGIAINDKKKISSERLIDNFDYLGKMCKGIRDECEYPDNLELNVRVSVENIESYIKEVGVKSFGGDELNIYEAIMADIIDGIYNKKMEGMNLLIEQLNLINKYLDENKDEFIEHPRRLEKEIKEDATASESASLETFQKLWLFPNVVQVDDLLNLVDIYGDELVNAAIKLAGSKDVPKNRAISFLTASLQEWADANVKTIEQAREYQRTRGAKKQGYNQKPIREEQLPDWAENPVEEPQISPERQAEIDAKLAAYLSEKNQRKEQVE